MGIGDQPAWKAGMTDEQPFYAPDKRPAAARTAKPGEEVWRLRRDHQVLMCELRDDDRVGAGIDVQLLRDGELLASRRCVHVEDARFVAERQRQNRLRTGWTE